MSWYDEAEAFARRDPSVRVLMDRAKQHRKRAGELSVNGDCNIEREEHEARRLEAEAEKIVMVAIAKAGVACGEFKQYVARQDQQRGLVIEVETDQGWNPDPFWSETPVQEEPQSVS